MLDRCANAACNHWLRKERVIQITTNHIRSFCDENCLIEGRNVHYRQINAEVEAELRAAGEL